MQQQIEKIRPLLDGTKNFTLRVRFWRGNATDGLTSQGDNDFSHLTLAFLLGLIHEKALKLISFMEKGIWLTRAVPFTIMNPAKEGFGGHVAAVGHFEKDILEFLQQLDKEFGTPEHGCTAGAREHHICHKGELGRTLKKFESVYFHTLELKPLGPHDPVVLYTWNFCTECGMCKCICPC